MKNLSTLFSILFPLSSSATLCQKLSHFHFFPFDSDIIKSDCKREAKSETAERAAALVLFGPLSFRASKENYLKQQKATRKNQNYSMEDMDSRVIMPRTFLIWWWLMKIYNTWLCTFLFPSFRPLSHLLVGLTWRHIYVMSRKAPQLHYLRLSHPVPPSGSYFLDVGISNGISMHVIRK